MFKPTQPLLRSLRRLALTTKQVNGGYYKGTGSGSMGRHTKYGGYVVEWAKVRTYVVPKDLKDFKVRTSCLETESLLLTRGLKLTPFVTKNMEPLKGYFAGDPKGGMSGERYLSRWKTENGVD
ncbi:hypothetical protein MMC08_003015 [Hypocenomyce scalaris]|nr:hypothetical protein [Hypocenomyce scalaris]